MCLCVNLLVPACPVVCVCFLFDFKSVLAKTTMSLSIVRKGVAAPTF